MDTAHLITHLVKFLRKLSKIEGIKNFLKRGEVDLIYFTPLIMILLILNDFENLWRTYSFEYQELAENISLSDFGYRRFAVKH